MGEWSAGTVRKARGKWQGVLSRGHGKEREQRTKLFDIASEPGTNKGRPAALKALAEWRAEVTAEEERPRRDPSQTLAAFMGAYVDGCAVHAEPSTVAGYRYVLRKQVAPYPVAAIPLDDLGPSDVRAWLAALSEDYGPTSVNKAFVLVRSAMRQAVGDGRLVRNPTDGVKPPKRPAPKPNALTGQQCARLARTLAEANQTPDIVGMRIALYTGMREAEVCALRWRNVDLSAHTLNVREAIGKADGKLYIKEPKTGGSRRTVCYPETLAAALKARRAEMVEQCMAAGVPFSPDMFVLGYIDRDDKTGDYRFFHPHVLWERWRTLADLLGLVGTQGKPPTFHDLRHTFATLAITEGVDVKTVSSTLGHANAAMTLNIYADADPNAKKHAADAIGSAIERDMERYDGAVLRLATGTEG